MWRFSFVLFLSSLMPLTPLLGQIQEDALVSSVGADLPKETHPSPPLFHSRTELAMFLLYGSAPPKGDACSNGTRDAEAETGGTLWFILGMFTMPYGVAAAYLVSPSPSPEKIAGKSSSYIVSYTDCYKSTAKGIHVKWAWIGFGTAVVLVLILFIAVYATSHTGKLGD